MQPPQYPPPGQPPYGHSPQGQPPQYQPSPPPQKPNNTLAIVLSVVGIAVVLCVIVPAVMFTLGLRKFGEGIQSAAGQSLNESNMRQIATAIDIYTTDHNDVLPSSHNWMDAIDLYGHHIDETYRSPLFPNSQYAYAFNSALSGWKTTSLAHPTETVLVFNTTLNVRNAAGGPEIMALVGEDKKTPAAATYFQSYPFKMEGKSPDSLRWAP